MFDLAPGNIAVFFAYQKIHLFFTLERRRCDKTLDVYTAPAFDAFEATLVNEDLLETIAPYIPSLGVTI